MAVTVRFGNLTTVQMVEKLGIDLFDKEVDLLEEMRTDNAGDILKGRWHCFSNPFVLVVGDDDTTSVFERVLRPHSKDMKENLRMESLGK